RNRDEGENGKRLEEKARMKLADLSHHSQHTDPAVLDKKRAVIEAALARARAKREAATNVRQAGPD
ncbi:MAG: ferredoxin, partial [Rhodoferax sp.]